MEENETPNAVVQLAELAMESDLADPIDWGMLNLSERDAFMLMASNVLQQMESIEGESRMVVAMATITKLLVENFVLNVRLKGIENVANGV